MAPFDFVYHVFAWACMRVHAGALLSFEPDTCMRVGFVGFGRACALVSARDTGHMQAHCFRSGGTRWRAGVHARWFRPGTPDTCRRVAFVRAGRDGARTCMRVVLGRRRGTHAGSLVSAGRDVMARAGWEAKFRPGVFVGFVHIFATARWLPLKQIFRRVFSFLAYLNMQRSRPAIFLIQNHNQPSTLARMAGLDLNAPLEEEAYTPGND